jgi:hypothetical protein
MAYYYWVGSTGQGLNNYNWNYASNWRENKYVNGRYTFVVSSYAPGHNDGAFVGDLYGPTAVSPCLFGGFSGSHTGGTWANARPGSATGATFTTSLAYLSLGNSNQYFAYSTGTSTKPSRPFYDKYNFPYIGGGVTGEVLGWLNSSLTAGWSANLASSVTTKMEEGLKLKYTQSGIRTLGYSDTKVSFESVKNYMPISPYAAGGTGATAPFAVSNFSYISTSPYRSGGVSIKGTLGTVRVYGATITGLTANHNTSEYLEFLGVTAGTISLDTCINTFIDENSKLANLTVEPTSWHGPVIFAGQVDTTRVNTELNLGLSGSTAGGTGFVDDSAIIFNSKIPTHTFYTVGGPSYNTSRPLGMYTQENGGGPVTTNDSFTPTFIIGTPTNNFTTTASLLRAKVSPLGASGAFTFGAVSTSPTIKFAGKTTISKVEMNNSNLSASWSDSDSGLSTGDFYSIPSDQLIYLNTVSLAENSVVDLKANPNFNNWAFGSIRNSKLSGGIYFEDETCRVNGSRDIRLVNDTVIANGTWSKIFGKTNEILSTGNLPIEQVTESRN